MVAVGNSRAGAVSHYLADFIAIAADWNLFRGGIRFDSRHIISPGALTRMANTESMTMDAGASVNRGDCSRV